MNATSTTSDTDLVERTFDGLWSRHGGPEVLAGNGTGGWPAALWQGLAHAELPWVAVPEAEGGAGGTLADGCAVWRSVGRTGCPLPVAETALAGWLLAAAGLAVPRAPLSVFPDAGTLALGGADGTTMGGTADRVPWASEVDFVVGLVPGPDGLCVVRVPRSALTVRRSTNLAGEPRDGVDVAGFVVPPDHLAVAPAWLDAEAYRRRGALVRAQQLAGAMSAALDRTIRYASERVQFGRPIGRFQAVAHLIVRAAAEAAAARTAADVAAVALDHDAHAVEVAAAKALAGEAAGTVAAHCHQVHGAIGMTQEYPLQHWTRRLWSWRDEFGGTARWRRAVGEAMLRGGADDLWAMVAADPVTDAGGGVR